MAKEKFTVYWKSTLRGYTFVADTMEQAIYTALGNRAKRNQPIDFQCIQDSKGNRYCIEGQLKLVNYKKV